MRTKILIVEDQFVEANNMQGILERAGYEVTGIARSVQIALKMIEKEQPHMVMLDILLQGNLTGIDLAARLREMKIAFVYLSANSDKPILDAAKATRPYGFLVKPFRAKDVLVMLDVAWYLHQHAEEEVKNSDEFLKNGKIFAPGELKEIIGKSPAVINILNNVKIVSQSDTAVLILGESGTGKELIAQAIHRLSSRRNKPLIVVNCGALPANLIESELFGHERGSFTGAFNRRIGKFEQADGGTIFLDEIGELPLDLQVKFLRVLQEKEIERIGGVGKKVDVRIIAATNRNLEEEISAGRFRLDLYYRLNIFPIVLPPLRERPGDVLLLADYFLKKYADKQGKSITGFSDEVINQISQYSWPGNVRELENMMERSVLLSMGNLITNLVLPKDKNKAVIEIEVDKVKTIAENERDYILAILDKCDWKVYGEGGAAQMLGIKVSTLNSRMKKLGIDKKHYNRK
ncbi:DNA-binding transcriptional response regulator, NtrC family, contains REC, AAA-type ATPase, and a Fis-type DNA-binding domains [Chitinophaga sp. YR627]|uniref:sigma-54-dependent transcriptional regulator n=1 Tax=Chitinophaga sp. YR627 TaxID=1881041 RepID=UPI0008E01FFB|nr:sigma-54 dependent transcriptional regulator [Chitinophaga sp. YR627]SFM89720.1 DNA-binding transcriptional response regulator, NtrC family, contains REC, AAA-type ATPase, and a Fis-type DNA-binding domains [Chitinophaga sp. YR627]